MLPCRIKILQVTLIRSYKHPAPNVIAVGEHIGQMTHSTTTIYHVGAARDAHHVDLRHASVVIHRNKIVQISRTNQVSPSDFPNATTINLPNVLVLPRMANAHAHLDMSVVTPRPYRGSFDQWLLDVLKNCPSGNDVIPSVTQGWQDSVASGVGLIGDIARYPQSAVALAQANAGYHAVSFQEFFGQGNRQATAIEQLNAAALTLTSLHENTGLVTGLQPHAPYSAGLGLYQAAADASHKHPLRLSTHLAETLEEEQFIRHASGMYRDMLERINKWDDSITANHLSPVQRLAGVLADARWLVAHCNYVDDADIQTLANTQTAVAYCPVASDYFGHREHRYRDMLSAGVNVCLGTDSLMCQNADERQPLGMMAQMRHLYARDQTAPSLLLAMATTRGAQALGADDALVTLQTDSPGNVMAVHFDPHVTSDPFTQALRSSEPLHALQSLGEAHPKR